MARHAPEKSPEKKAPEKAQEKAQEKALEKCLSMEFVVVGHTLDDDSLLETGKIFVTGPYQAAEAIALIQTQQVQAQ